MIIPTLLENWHLLAVSVLMIVGAVIDGWMLKVPNWQTGSMVLFALVYWTLAGGFGWHGLLGSFAGMLLAGSLLLPLWLIGGMGGGDCKLYAGFGAWVMPLPWFGPRHLLLAAAYSIVLGGVMAIAQIIWHRQYVRNILNAQDMLGDINDLLAKRKSLDEVRERAKERKPTLTLLPYGVPLTIGSLIYLWWVASTMGPLAAVAASSGP